RSTGACRCVMVPTTSRRSDCRGVKRGRVRPKRSVSKRGPVTDMYSMPQQAVTKGYWKKANFRAQARASSYFDVKNESRRSPPPGAPTGGGDPPPPLGGHVPLPRLIAALGAARAAPRAARSLLCEALREVGLVDDHARPAGALGRIAVGRAPELAGLGVHTRL